MEAGKGIHGKTNMKRKRPEDRHMETGHLSRLRGCSGAKFLNGIDRAKPALTLQAWFGTYAVQTGSGSVPGLYEPG